MANNNNNNNWKRIGGFSRTGTQNYVRTNDAAMGGTTFGSTDVSNNVGNTTLRIGNNAGVVYINGDIDMSGGVNVVAPINRIRNVRDPIAPQDVATKFYVDKTIDAVIMSSVDGVITGPTGPEGPPGIGIPGTNGSGGPIGHTGPTGPLGATGSSFGVKGPTGERGGTGSTGANGAAGATGPIGPIGEKGEQGTQGTQGIQGSNGTILWLNPDGDSPTNQLITDSYLLSKVPINASVRTVGPISVSATYGNVNKIIPASRFFNTAIEVSTLAVIPSGVWVLNLYANVPSNSDANQVALYAAVFMISGTLEQPSPDSLVIETKDGGDAGYYPPRAAYLPDHVKYIGKSWASTENVLTSNTDTTNKGAVIDGTSRKLYKLEMPVEFITLKDAAGNRENVYVQLQIYVRNTKEANQTANVSLYFQTDATTNETTYSYLQTTFGAVGIQGIPGSTGSTGAKGDNGLIGPAGPAGATGSAGPTGIAGPVGPRGSQGPTGVTGPGGSSNSYGVQYAVQYRGNQSTGDTDNSGNFRGDTNFRYIPTGYINRLTDATAGSVVLNDLACNSIHSPVYVQDTSIVVGSGTTRPRTYIRGGELVNSGSSAEQSNYVVLASGTDTTNGNNSKTAVSVNDITNGIKMIHNYGTKKVTFQVHDENKVSGTVGLQFDLNGSAVLGNISAAQDQFCIVNSSGAAGVGGITAAQLSASAHTALNRMLHVRGNIMVGSDPGGVNQASNAMVLLNKSTTTPSTPISGYPGVYHRQIASGEVTALGGATNSIATSGEGLGVISPNFITFQTVNPQGGYNNSIVINQAGVVSVTGRTNLNGAVSVNKNFGTVETHDSVAPVMDISGTLSVSTGATNFTDVPRIKLISRGIAANSSIPSVTPQSQPSTSNEIRGVSSNSSISGFLRLSAQTPAHSCIDLIGLNTSASAYNNAVRISTGGNERMIVNGSGNVGIGTNAPERMLDVNGEARIRNNLWPNSKILVGTTEFNIATGCEIGYESTNVFALWNYRESPMRFGTSNYERMRILANGNVGIGTNAPSVALDVTGAAKVSTILSAQTGLILGDNTKTAMDFGVDDSTGCLLNLFDTGVNKKPRIRFVSGTNATLDIGCYPLESYIWSNGDRNFRIATNNLPRFTITGAGKVEMGEAQLTASSATATALTTVGRIGVNTTTPTVDLDVSGIANVSNYLSVGSGSSGSGAATSILPNAFYVRIGGTNWRDYIPLLSANSTTNVQTWGPNADSQWHTGYTAANEIGKQFSYFAAYWLTVNRAEVNTVFQVPVYSTNYSGTFSFEAKTLSNGVVTAYQGQLIPYSDEIYNLQLQQDGIDAGVARRSLSNRTVLMGGSVETGYLGVSGSSRLTASSATATALTTVGRIGVNTTTPSVALDVNGESQFRGKTIQETNLWQQSSDGKNRFYFVNNGTTYFGTGDNYVWRSSANNSLNTDIMVLLSNGRLGIMTTTPNTALDVNGRIRAIGGIKLGPDSTTTDDMTQDSSLDINNATIARSRFICGSNRLTIGMSSADSFIYNESNTPMRFVTNNYERMRITEGGSVGIGTNAPTKTLDVNGEARIRNNLWPNSKIYVGTSEFDVTTGFEIGYESTNVFALWNYRETPMRFGTSRNERMRIAANGNVGIGTNAPSVALDVNGESQFRGKTIQQTNLWQQSSDGKNRLYFTNNSSTYFGTGDNYLWRSSANNSLDTDIMVLLSNGNLGIGTNAPSAPLHVAIKRSVAIGTTAFYGFAENVSYWVGRWAGGTYNVAIISGGDVWVQGNYIWVSSDKRIKRNIRDIEGTTALSQVRKIRPKVYNYIDHTKGTQDIYGFIAQDTEDIIAYSSNIVKDYIPNFYCKGDIATIDQTNHIYEISTENELKFEKVIDTSGNEISNYKIKLYDDKNNQYICTVIHRNDAKTIRVKCDKEFIFSTIEEYKNAVFIYGQEVNDFYNLDKNAIFTVATAALQEVDRQQQADKARIAELENQVSNLEATVASQQSLINDILERLKNLEA